ncbi:MAG: hypothetical protein EOO60_06580 [Hymenobacter sp.]|nr:MAG: hypothetical protein EOO60_06580 [Hymenobacter sp.]
MKLLLTIAAPLLAATLVSCSQATPESDGTATTSATNQTTAIRTTGTRVDSLNGIPGHRFGEPRSAFPGLIAAPSEPGAMKRYYYLSSQTLGTGWFARHDKDFTINYFFVNDKFATITVTAYGDRRKLLSDEAAYLFGLGDHYKLDGVIWKGKEAYATYENTFTPQGPAARLEIGSESLAATQKKQEAARLKTDNELK